MASISTRALLFLGFVPFSLAVQPVSFVSPDGRFQSHNIKKLIEDHLNSSKVCFLSSVGVPGCRMEEVLDSIFGTAFDGTSHQRARDSKPNCQASVSPFVPGLVIFSSECYTNAPGMSLHGSSDMLLFHIWASDTMRDIASNTQTLRQIFTQYHDHYHEQRQNENTNKLPIVILLHNYEIITSEATLVDNLLTHEFEKKMEDIWNSVCKHSVKMNQVFDVFWHPVEAPTVDTASDGSLNGARGGGDHSKLKRFLQPTVASLIGRSITSALQSLDTKWEQSTTDRGSLGQLEDHSRSDVIGVFLLDEASRSAKRQVKDLLHKFRRRAEKGQVVRQFGETVSEIALKILNEFDSKTRPLLLLGPRGRHAELLSEKRSEKRSRIYTSLDENIKQVQELMIANVKEMSEEKLNKMLLSEVRKLKDPREALPDVVVNDIVEAVQFETKSLLSEMVVPCFTSSSSQLLSEVDHDGYAEKANEFEQQAETKALRRDLFLRFSQRHSTLPKKPRGISPKLDMVAYFCAPGQGNFNGYSTVGFSPNVNLLVVAENSHRGEEKGDLRKLLTFQPKIHFDINI